MVKHVERNLELRGYNSKDCHHSRAQLVENGKIQADMPDSLCVLKQTPQVEGIHTFIRNRSTPRDEFIFYAKRMIRILIEYALSLLPYQTVRVQTPQVILYQSTTTKINYLIIKVSLLVWCNPFLSFFKL